VGGRVWYVVRVWAGVVCAVCRRKNECGVLGCVVCVGCSMWNVWVVHLSQSGWWVWYVVCVGVTFVEERVCVSVWCAVCGVRCEVCGVWCV